MWLFRGAQSAVFYYMACTPCAESIDRRHRKRTAAQTPREPFALQPGVSDINGAGSAGGSGGIITQQPRFQQAVPFTANPFWQEEIDLGPGPPARRHKSKKKSSPTTRSLASGPSSDDSSDSPGGNRLGGVLEDLSIPIPRLAKKDKDKDVGGDFWNRDRYQREDELLWSGIGRSKTGRSSTSSRSYVQRNPEVNDLHPPVVCGPFSREETRWMIQPPPSAKVMAGKARVSAADRAAAAGIHRQNTSRRRPTLVLPDIPDESHDDNRTHTKDRDFGHGAANKDRQQPYLGTPSIRISDDNVFVLPSADDTPETPTLPQLQLSGAQFNSTAYPSPPLSPSVHSHSPSSPPDSIWFGKHDSDNGRSAVRRATANRTKELPLMVPSGDGKTMRSIHVEFWADGSPTVHQGRWSMDI